MFTPYRSDALPTFGGRDWWPLDGPLCHLTRQDDDLIASGERVYYPRGLVPEIENPRVRLLGASAERAILARHAMRPLQIIDRAEMLIVAPATAQIVQAGERGGWSAEIAEGARRISTQEDYHSEKCNALHHQIKVRLEPPLTPAEQGVKTAPEFLSERINDLPEDVREAGQVCAAANVETQFSEVQWRIPNDVSVVKAVRDINFAHAKEETLHRQWFSGLFIRYWPTLDADIQNQVAPLLVTATQAFTKPDLAAATLGLIAVGLTPDEAARVIAESYPEAAVQASMRAAAKYCLETLARAGVFDRADHRRLFQIAALID